MIKFMKKFEIVRQLSIDGKRLTLIESSLVDLIFEYQINGNYFYQSNKYISNLFGVSEAAIKYAKAKLNKIGLIEHCQVLYKNEDNKKAVDTKSFYIVNILLLNKLSDKEKITEKDAELIKGYNNISSKNTFQSHLISEGYIIKNNIIVPKKLKKVEKDEVENKSIIPEPIKEPEVNIPEPINNQEELITTFTNNFNRVITIDKDLVEFYNTTLIKKKKFIEDLKTYEYGDNINRKIRQRKEEETQYQY